MLEKMSEMIAEQLNCDAETITADTSSRMTWEQIPLTSSSLLWLWKTSTTLRFRQRSLQS